MLTLKLIQLSKTGLRFHLLSPSSSYYFKCTTAFKTTDDIPWNFDMQVNTMGLNIVADRWRAVLSSFHTLPGRLMPANGVTKSRIVFLLRMIYQSDWLIAVSHDRCWDWDVSIDYIILKISGYTSLKTIYDIYLDNCFTYGEMHRFMMWGKSNTFQQDFNPDEIFYIVPIDEHHATLS